MGQKRSTVGKFVLVLEIAAALTSAIAMFTSKTRENINSLIGQCCMGWIELTYRISAMDFSLHSSTRE